MWNFSLAILIVMEELCAWCREREKVEMGQCCRQVPSAPGSLWGSSHKSFILRLFPFSEFSLQKSERMWKERKILKWPSSFSTGSKVRHGDSRGGRWPLVSNCSFLYPEDQLSLLKCAKWFIDYVGVSKLGVLQVSYFKSSWKLLVTGMLIAKGISSIL